MKARYGCLRNCRLWNCRLWNRRLRDSSGVLRHRHWRAAVGTQATLAGTAGTGGTGGASLPMHPKEFCDEFRNKFRIKFCDGFCQLHTAYCLVQTV